MPILVAAHLLKPLGNPLVKIVKYFATLELLEQVKNRGSPRADFLWGRFVWCAAKPSCARR